MIAKQRALPTPTHTPIHTHTHTHRHTDTHTSTCWLAKTSIHFQWGKGNKTERNDKARPTVAAIQNHRILATLKRKGARLWSESCDYLSGFFKGPSKFPLPYTMGSPPFLASPPGANERDARGKNLPSLMKETTFYSTKRFSLFLSY